MSGPYDMIGPADHLEELVAEQAREIEWLRVENERLRSHISHLEAHRDNLMATNAELVAALRRITSIDEYLVDGKDCTATLMRKFAHAALAQAGGKE